LPTRDLQKIKTISYGGLAGHVFLWQKAFLLVPLWAIAIVPIVGFICRSLNNTAMQLGFGLMLCLSAAYFVEDLLKRKIRLDDEYLFFGFQSIPLKTIKSVDVIYKKSKFLPAALNLTCLSGRTLKLNLNGVSQEGVETLLKQLESHNSTLKIAAVLNTLVKCRSVKRKSLEAGDRLELPYQSRRLLSESIDVFKSTAAKWTRIGPVVTCLLFTPLWLNWLSTLYTCLHPRFFQRGATATNLQELLNQIINLVGPQFGKALSGASETIGWIAVNPLVVFVTGSSIFLFCLYLFHLLWRPNYLVADSGGIKLILRTGELSIPLAQVSWDRIEAVDLHKTGHKAGQIHISKTDRKSFDIDLSAITPEDRSLLLRRIERLVPTNRIDHELSQAMLTRSDRSYTEIWLQSLNQPPERKALEPLQPGQLVGEDRFEVLRAIGVGGQGKAYLCRIVDGDKAENVVLKETIMPIFADSGARRKALEGFEQEASLLKKLNNDGVVKLLDYFVEDHRAYLVLEHIDGCNLRELVARDGPLPDEQVRELALQMCDILRILHDSSIVHRDFTPDNLILNSRGKLKLIDFNVAQQIQGGSSGTIVGKHAYLPPEQFRGKAVTQSDLYAMGASLFFLLTGADPDPISQSSPRIRNTGISTALDHIVQKATALQVNQRYESVDYVAADLGASEMPSEPEVISTLTGHKTEVRQDG
jgi:serine/threonine protein kinase